MSAHELPVVEGEVTKTFNEIKDSYLLTLAEYADDEYSVISLGTLMLTMVKKAGELRQVIDSVASKVLSGDLTEEQGVSELWNGRLLIMTKKQSTETAEQVTGMLEEQIDGLNDLVDSL